ncbi:arylamine N-acetyltransferase [Spirosoma lituiforme]|jgi:arylamine N-acetyltransferase
MSPDEIAFEEKYVFHLVEVPIHNFQELCYFKQTSESAHFVKNIVYTKPTLLGRKTLFNNKLTLREGDQKNVLLLTSESELIQTLKREFAIDISLYRQNSVFICFSSLYLISSYKLGVSKIQNCLSCPSHEMPEL